MGNDYLIEEVIERLKQIENKIDVIHSCLYGDMSKPEPNGLVQRVRKNTEFRQEAEQWMSNSRKRMWTVITIGVAAVLKFVFDLVRDILGGR